MTITIDASGNGKIDLFGELIKAQGPSVIASDPKAVRNGTNLEIFIEGDDKPVAILTNYFNDDKYPAIDGISSDRQSSIDALNIGGSVENLFATAAGGEEDGNTNSALIAAQLLLDKIFGEVGSHDGFKLNPIFVSQYRTLFPQDNQDPIANDDGVVIPGLQAQNNVIEIEEDSANVFIDVLNNDSDPDGDALSIVGAFEPEHGTVSFNDGAVFYTPDPNYNGFDSFEYIISDGFGFDSAVVLIQVLPVNDEPEIHCDFSQNDLTELDELFVNEDTPLAIKGLSISDVDNNDNNDIQVLVNPAPGKVWTVNITVDYGVVTLGSFAGLTFDPAVVSNDGVADSSLTFSGTIENINAALETLTFLADPNFNDLRITDLDYPSVTGPAKITLNVSDNGFRDFDDPAALTDSKSFEIRVNPINDAPVIHCPEIEGQEVVDHETNEEMAIVFDGSPNGTISISDVDILEGTEDVTVTLVANFGTVSLNAGHIGDLTFSTGTGTNDASMTFTGKLSDVNQALQGMSYQPAEDFNHTLLGPNEQSGFIITVDDLGNTPVLPTSVNGHLTDEKFIPVKVNAVNDAPVIHCPTIDGGHETDEDTPLTFSQGSGNPIFISDVDNGEVPGGVWTVSLVAENGTMTLWQTTGLTFLPVDPTNDGTNDTSLTFSGTIEDINAALDGLVFNPDLDYNDNRIGGDYNLGEAKITINVNDNGNNPAPALDADPKELIISVVPDNDAPEINCPPVDGGVHVVEEDNPLTFNSANAGVISLDDVDVNENGTGELQMTLEVQFGTLTLDTSGLTLPGDLNFISGSNGSSSMTVQGTLDNLNAALDGLVYMPDLNHNDNLGDEKLSIKVDDLGNTSNPAQSGQGSNITEKEIDISVTAVNDGPEFLKCPGDPQSMLEDGELTFTGNNKIKVDDVDYKETPGGLLSVTIEVTNGIVVLNPAHYGDLVSPTANGASTITFQGTKNNINQALDGMKFIPDADFNGPANLYIKVDDQGFTGTPGSLFVEKNVAINVAAVNDKPEIECVLPQGGLMMNEDAGPLAISGLTLKDIDEGEALSPLWTLKLDVLNDVGEMSVDLLGLTTVTLTSNPLDPTFIVLEGSLAELNLALDTLEFDPNDNFNGTAQIKIDLDDNGNNGSTGFNDNLSDSKTLDIEVKAINDEPFFTEDGCPDDQQMLEDGTLLFNLANQNQIKVADVDVDEGTGQLEVTLTVTNGKLTLGQKDGLTFSQGDGTKDATMTFTGTVTEINDALEGLKFKPTGDFNGNANLTVLVNDLGNTGAPGPQTVQKVIGIEVLAVNDAPVIHCDDDSYTIDEDASLNITDLSISDVDVAEAPGNGKVKVEISVDVGTLTLADDSNLVFLNSTTNGSATLEFKGLLADVNAAIADLTFNPPADYYGPAVINILVSDKGNTGDPGALTDSKSINVTVDPVNDGPEIHCVDPSFSVDEDNDLSVTGLSISDIDVGTNELEVHLSVNDGVLNFGSTAGLTFIDGTANGESVLKFTGTLADINAALTDLTFDSDENFNGDVDLNIFVSDQGFTGGVEQTDTKTVDITVNAVNDAPEFLDCPGDPQSMLEDGELVFNTTNTNEIRVGDIDYNETPGGLLSVTIEVTNGIVVLNPAHYGDLVSPTANGASTITFQGTKFNINQALDGMKFIPDADFNGVANIEITVDDQGFTGASGPLSAVKNFDINVAAVNDAPEIECILPQGGLSMDEDAGPLAIAGLTLKDVDEGEAVSPLWTLKLDVLNDVGEMAVDLTGLTTVTLTSNPSDPTFVVLEGSLAELNLALNTLEFDPNDNFNGTAQIKIDLEDNGNNGIGGNLVDSKTLDIEVNPVNDGPEFVDCPDDQQMLEDGVLFLSSATVGGPNHISISDIDVDETAGGVVEISLEVTDGKLTLSQTTGLSFTQGDGVKDAKMTFTGSVDDINDALDGLKFKPDGDFNGNVNLLVLVDDQGNTGAPGPQTVQKVIGIEVLAVNDAPIIHCEDDSYTIDEDASLNITDLSISDVDVAEAPGNGKVKVEISVNVGTLTLADDSNLVFLNSTTNGSATLEFKGLLADVNAAIADLTFNPPADYYGPAVINILVNDKGNTGDPGALTDSKTINVTVDPVNDGPEIHCVDSSFSVDEDNDLSVTGLSISDIDVDTNDLEVHLSVNDGVLNFGSTAGLTFIDGTANGESVLKFTGTLADINAALTDLTFDSDKDFNGDVDLDIFVSDQGFTGGVEQTDTKTVDITVNPVNDAPELVVVPGDPQSVDEDGALVFKNDNGNKIIVADVDAAESSPGNLLITITATNGVVELPSLSGLTGVTGNNTGSLSFQGTVAQVNSALEGLAFKPTPDFSGTATITIDVNDQGNTGSGGALNDSISFDVNVNEVNDGPDAVDNDYLTDEETVITTGNIINDDTGAGVDSDPESDPLLVVSFSEINGVAVNPGATLTLASGAKVTVNANGSFNYNPDAPGSSHNSLGVGQTAVDTIEYTITDGNGGSDTATVSFTVNGVNDSPVAKDNAYDVDENNSVSGNIKTDDTGAGVDSDVDGDPLTVTRVDNVIANVGVPVVLAKGGTLTVNSDGTFTYDANTSALFEQLGVGETDTETFTYRINDGQGGKDDATVVITVHGKNDVPDAVKNDYSTDEDSAISGNVITDDTGAGTDSDPDGDTLAVVEVNGSLLNVGSTITLASGAELKVNADGSYDYDPSTSASHNALGVGDSAVDSFTYKISDGNGGFDTATVSFTVNGSNDKPIAVKNDYTTNEETSVNGNVITDNTGAGIDSDPDGDTLTVTRVNGSNANVGTEITLASGAKLTVNSDGSFDYNPATSSSLNALGLGESAVDSFTYRVSDGNDKHDTATVTFTVHGANDAPIAKANFYTVLEDAPAKLMGNVINDDTGAGVDEDPDANDTITVSKVNGNPSNVGSEITLASGAKLKLNADGSYEYDPSMLTDNLEAGEIYDETFSYSIVDNGGLESTALVTIRVTGENEAPDARNNEYATDESSIVGGNVIADDTGAGVDSDPDGDSLTVTRVNGSNANVGSEITLASGAKLTVNSDGTFSYDPNGAFDGLGAGQSDTDSFTYRVSDGNGGHDTATVTFAINGLNNGPDAVNDAFTTDEDVPLQFNVITPNDTDPDGDTLTIDTFTQPANGTVVLDNVDGTFTYTPDANYNGPDSFTYTITDGNGGSDTATVTLVVDSVNDAPIAKKDTVSVDEDDSVVIDVLDNDFDIDGTIDPTTVVITSPPSNGSVSVNPTTGEVTYTPDPDYNGPDQFKYTVNDNDGATSNEAKVKITVDPINDAPDAMDDAFTTDEDVPLQFNVITPNDTDPDGDTLSIDSFTQPTNGTVVLDNVDGTFTYTPDANYNGSDSFTYTIKDGNGGFDTATVSLTVDPVNDAPIAKKDNATTDEDTSVVIDLLANDSDVDSALDPNSIVITNQPSNGSVVLGPLPGQVTYTPDPDYNGPDQFKYTVADVEGAVSNKAKVNITVNAVNDAPFFTECPDPQTVDEDNILTFTTGVNGFVIDDVDVDEVANGGTGEVSVTLSVNDGTLTLGSLTGISFLLGAHGEESMQIRGLLADVNAALDGLQYTPDANYNGADELEIVVDDLGNTPNPAELITKQVPITVNPVNGDPDAVDDHCDDVNLIVNGSFEDYSTASSPDSQFNGSGWATFDLSGEGDPSLIPGWHTRSTTADGTPKEGPLELQFGTVGGIAAQEGNVKVELDGANQLVSSVETTNVVLYQDIVTEVGMVYELSFWYAPRNSGTTADTDNVEVYWEGQLLDIELSRPQNGWQEFTVLVEAESNVGSRLEFRGAGTADGVGGYIDSVSLVEKTKYSTDEDTTITVLAPFGVLANDTDPDNDLLEVISINGSNITSGDTVAIGSGALVTMNSDGSFSYDPNGKFDSLDAGESALDTFSYTISDGNGGTDTATVKIKINGISNGPEIEEFNIGADGTFDDLCIKEDGTGELKISLQVQSDALDPATSKIVIKGFDPAWGYNLAGLNVGGGSAVINAAMTKITISGITDANYLGTLLITPLPDSDVDMAGTLQGTATATNSAGTDELQDTSNVVVDAVADDVTVEVNAEGVGQDGVDVTVTATFGDATDGSETHTVILEIPGGIGAGGGLIGDEIIVDGASLDASALVTASLLTDLGNDRFELNVDSYDDDGAVEITYKLDQNYLFQYDRSGDAQNNSGGLLEEVNATYDPNTGMLTFSMRAQNSTGFTLALNNGPDPKDSTGDLVLFYFDAGVNNNLADDNPVVSVYEYNGQNNDASYSSGPLLASSVTDDIDVNFYDGIVTNILSFSMNVKEVLGSGNESLASFDEELGLWLHPFQNLNTAYNQDNELTVWSGTQGWLDLTFESTARVQSITEIEAEAKAVETNTPDVEKDNTDNVKTATDVDDEISNELSSSGSYVFFSKTGDTRDEWSTDVFAGKPVGAGQNDPDPDVPRFNLGSAGSTQAALDATQDNQADNSGLYIFDYNNNNNVLVDFNKYQPINGNYGKLSKAQLDDGTLTFDFYKGTITNFEMFLSDQTLNTPSITGPAIDKVVIKDFKDVRLKMGDNTEGTFGTKFDVVIDDLYQGTLDTTELEGAVEADILLNRDNDNAGDNRLKIDTADEFNDVINIKVDSGSVGHGSGSGSGQSFKGGNVEILADLGSGNDEYNVEFSNQGHTSFSTNGGTVQVLGNLGEGNDTLDVNFVNTDVYTDGGAMVIDVDLGQGNDEVSIRTSEDGGPTDKGDSGVTIDIGLGEGDDTFKVSEFVANVENLEVRGWNGFDVLKIDSDGLDLDFGGSAAGIDSTNFKAFEAIDMRGSDQNELTLIAADVINITDADDELYVVGDSYDKVELTGFAEESDVPFGIGQLPGMYKTYTDGTTTVYVHEDINVTGLI